MSKALKSILGKFAQYLGLYKMVISQVLRTFPNLTRSAFCEVVAWLDHHDIEIDPPHEDFVEKKRQLSSFSASSRLVVTRCRAFHLVPSLSK